MALAMRRPNGVIHHSDQGCQYTSIEFGHRCREAGVRPSMGSVGDAYDNAMCESFFATLECELLDRRRFKTQAEARIAVFEFIEGFYNPRRRHSSIGYLSPIDYERHAANPDAHQTAAVLAAVKDKPFGRPRSGAVLDRRCARRPHSRAGRWKNGSAGGRTKECHQTGGQNVVRQDTLIPSPKPSTKPGQVQQLAYGFWARHAFRGQKTRYFVPSLG